MHKKIEKFLIKVVVSNQTEKICLAAVRKSGMVLPYVKNKTEKILLEAKISKENALEDIALQDMDGDY